MESEIAEGCTCALYLVSFAVSLILDAAMSRGLHQIMCMREEEWGGGGRGGVDVRCLSSFDHLYTFQRLRFEDAHVEEFK